MKPNTRDWNRCEKKIGREGGGGHGQWIRESRTEVGSLKISPDHVLGGQLNGGTSFPGVRHRHLVFTRTTTADGFKQNVAPTG